MRYVIKFTKNSNIKFISHLDLLRTLQRVVRRADLPVEYSQGFNPHMTMSLAQPLSVGIYSDGEYLDTVFNEELDENYVKDALNDKTPEGISFKAVYKVMQNTEKKVPQTMALIDAAAYEISVKYDSAENLDHEMKKLLDTKEWVTLKKSKSGEKMVDVRPMVKELTYVVDGNTLKISALTSCGSKENLSPELLANYVKDNTTNSLREAFVDIKRLEMFTDVNGKLVSLGKYIGKK